MRTGRAEGLTITASVIALALSLLMSTSAQASPADSGTSARVVDGDTIVAAVGATEERVRFLNIDTPEVGTCLAGKATSFTTRALPAGQSIVLRYDRELRDKYGRLLALVKPTNGEWLSVALAEQGLGFPLVIAPNSSYYPRVAAAADRAKRSRAGMFNPRRSCTPVSRARRANAMVGEAQSMPIRTAAQYRAASQRLNRAAALLALVSAARYGVESRYFRSYVGRLKAPVARRLVTVRAAKRRQWNAVRSSGGNGGGGSSSTTSSTSNDGWWPPGVPSSYTGPRCYQPGGVIWYPC